MMIAVEHLLKSDDLTPVFTVRKAVFQSEENIPEAIDVDGRDAAAEQFVAYDDERPIGTARYRLINNDTAKVERVAVLMQYRGKGVGQMLMKTLEEVAIEAGVKQIILNAMVSSRPFYLKLGYEMVGDEFVEANIAHIKMTKELHNA